MAELAQVDLDERQPEEAMRKIDVWIIRSSPTTPALYEMRAKVRLGSPGRTSRTRSPRPRQT